MLSADLHQYQRYLKKKTYLTKYAQPKLVIWIPVKWTLICLKNNLKKEVETTKKMNCIRIRILNMPNSFF